MTEEATGTGLMVIRDKRALTRNVPNDNPAIGSVGPQANLSEHVLYPGLFPPMQAQAWDGWPVGWNVPWTNGYGPFAQLATAVSTVWAGIDLNSRILSTMPPYAVKGAEPIAAPPWMLNPEPEVYASWEDFAKQMFTAYMLGETFLYVTGRYADGRIARFIMLNSDWVNVEFVDGLRRYTLGGSDITNDVLHIRYASWPGDARGHGPLEAASRNLLSAAVLERYAANLATQGGVPWAVLSHPSEMTDKQVTDLQNRWITARSRANGTPAILTGGFELKPLTLNPTEMALLELLQWNESRVAVLLGIPPTLLGLPSYAGSMTYNNMESIFDFHWRSGLRPMAQTVMSAISGWALPRGSAAELNRDQYVRPATAERIAAYATLFAIVDPVTGQRAITVEEIRAAERLSPLPVGEDPLDLTGIQGLTGAEQQ